MSTTNGGYYLPEPSHWPIVGSIGMFLTLGGFAYFLNDGSPIVMAAGAVVLLACLPLADRPPGDGSPQPSRFADAMRSKVFRRIHLSAFALGLALFVPFVFVGQYAKDRDIGSVRAAVLVGVLGYALGTFIGTLLFKYGSALFY